VDDCDRRTGQRYAPLILVDSGIETRNPQFGGRASWGTTVVPGAPDRDDNGHGTFVAGLIGSQEFGVAKRVNLIAVKVSILSIKSS
jgi:cerevisin